MAYLKGKAPTLLVHKNGAARESYDAIEWPIIFNEPRQLVNGQAQPTTVGRVVESIERLVCDNTNLASHDLIETLDSPIENIEYTAEDDADIEEWLRNNTSTTQHSVGICKKLLLHNNGVVDGNLSVHDVTGLKIADVTIIPHNAGAHANNIAMVIGEKAAEIFVGELGFSQ
ncbi:hypothetical protein CHU98_g7866 [Xylaria longipes]|nr:hypothetical protein CHU98_g7866 [Xylaria longipes]